MVFCPHCHTLLSVGKSAEAIIFVVRDEFQKYPMLKTHLMNEEAIENGFSGPPQYQTDQSVEHLGIPFISILHNQHHNRL